MIANETKLYIKIKITNVGVINWSTFSKFNQKYRFFYESMIPSAGFNLYVTILT